MHDVYSNRDNLLRTLALTKEKITTLAKRDTY